jgi:hypothetical protein
MKIPTAGFVDAAFNRHAGTAAYSFSSGEKDRMRGKNAQNEQAASFFKAPLKHLLTIKIVEKS